MLHNETMQYGARGKLLLAVNNGVSQFRQWYSGRGMLVANDWQELGSTIVHISDDNPTDPLGNVYRRRSSQGAEALPESQYPVYVTRYTPGSSRVSRVVKQHPSYLTTNWTPDSTAYSYDVAGNAILPGWGCGDQSQRDHRRCKR